MKRMWELEKATFDDLMNKTLAVYDSKITVEEAMLLMRAQKQKYRICTEPYLTFIWLPCQVRRILDPLCMVTDAPRIVLCYRGRRWVYNQQSIGCAYPLWRFIYVTQYPFCQWVIHCILNEMRSARIQHQMANQIQIWDYFSKLPSQIWSVPW